MHLKTRNVNTGFRAMLDGILSGEISVNRGNSRNGPVLRIPEPVTITYTHPTERVLINAARDANPFFHLYEALWMLAGRQDLAPLTYYVKRFADFSDDGKTLNGAYGCRWRCASKLVTETVETQFNEEVETLERANVDQLDLLVAHLKADPTSRRAVLQMWNVEDDLLKIGTPSNGANPPDSDWEVYDQTGASKDVCCNLSVMFALRTVHYSIGPFDADYPQTYLDMTVTNRSNDMIWGLFGANVVHFSVLQEYMAARLGVLVGVYNHFSNNVHVYENNWKPVEWLADQTAPPDYPKPFPLVRDPACFEKEMRHFAELHAREVFTPTKWEEPFLNEVAEPMMLAHHAYKRKAANTASWVERVKAEDWRAAARDWIERRLHRKEPTDVRKR